jgi:hypothetical protein
VGGLTLHHEASVIVERGEPTLRMVVRAASPHGGSLVLAVRPYNPEGVQFIDEIHARQKGDGWCVNSRMEVIADRPADQVLVSDYDHGDVFSRLGCVAGVDQVCGVRRPALNEGRPAHNEGRPAHNEGRPPHNQENSRPAHGLQFASNAAAQQLNGLNRIRCKTGMATAASVYRFSAPFTELTIRVPLAKELAAMGQLSRLDLGMTWQAVRSTVAALQIPNARWQFLYNAAVATLTLLSADEVVPGPYTYRRFWFRDACLMLAAILTIGLTERCRRAIERFPKRQLHNGYFRSQEGEWDSNGQALWIIDRYAALTGARLSEAVLKAVDKAVGWIDRKRVSADDPRLHAGLLPAGFSAEHLGPNDHYYWDDFWAEAGLRAAERINIRLGRNREAATARGLAQEIQQAIERSIERIPDRRSLGGIPASPYRRLDAGAVGSLVADYPLQLFPPRRRGSWRL